MQATNLNLETHALMSYDHLKFARNFLMGAMLIRSLAICGIFWGFEMRSERFTMSLLHQQAAEIFKQVGLIRTWVSHHGGVYVAGRPGSVPNPLLKAQCGAKALVTDRTNGSPYLLLNPCLVIREFSQLTSMESGYTFHVVSLKPLNPQTNSPDPFEQATLLRFNHGATEAATIEQRPDGPVYRAMVPIYYEPTCSRCHSEQGYHDGDVRGGVCVTIPMNEVNAKIYHNRLLAIGLAAVVLALLLGALTMIHHRFIKALTDAHQRLLEIATYDTLTGLLNRRAGLERVTEELSRQYRSGNPVACLLLDIDHFKKVNDGYGHLFGDQVLRRIGETLTACTRRHDIACRYGGEEFLLLLPDTGLEQAIATAEKIRAMIATLPVRYQERTLTITTSIGVTLMQSGEALESLIARADQALYQAKNEGRNRVCRNPASPF